MNVMNFCFSLRVVFRFFQENLSFEEALIKAMALLIFSIINNSDFTADVV